MRLLTFPCTSPAAGVALAIMPSTRSTTAVRTKNRFAMAPLSAMPGKERPILVVNSRSRTRVHPRSADFFKGEQVVERRIREFSGHDADRYFSYFMYAFISKISFLCKSGRQWELLFSCRQRSIPRADGRCETKADSSVGNDTKRSPYRQNTSTGICLLFLHRHVRDASDEPGGSSRHDAVRRHIACNYGPGRHDGIVAYG